MSTVAELMTRVLVTINPEQSVGAAMEAMKRGGVRHLPVVDAGRKLVGLVSRTDVATQNAEALVSEVMTREPITVSPKMRVSESVVMMLQHRINSLPVIDAKGELHGIVTSTDLLVEAYEALHAAEIRTGANDRTRIDVEDTVLRAKLERVRKAHHADMRAIALAELGRFLARHYQREEGDSGLFARLVERKPELSADVAELCEAHATILHQVEAQEAQNRELAARGDVEPSPGVDLLIRTIERHEQREASLASDAS